MKNSAMGRLTSIYEVFTLGPETRETAWTLSYYTRTVTGFRLFSQVVFPHRWFRLRTITLLWNRWKSFSLKCVQNPFTLQALSLLNLPADFPVTFDNVPSISRTNRHILTSSMEIAPDKRKKIHNFVHLLVQADKITNLNPADNIMQLNLFWATPFKVGGKSKDKIQVATEYM